MKHILSYKLFEGGNALDLVRPIKQSEVPATLAALQDIIFPALGLAGFDADAMLIGSAGKKANEDDESGDIDVGIDIASVSERVGISEDQVLKYIYDCLCRQFPVFQAKWMRGLEVVSFGYPIANDPSLGYVQIDFIPIKDMNWSRFIYHCPNYKKGESKYKSAHRNWLFAAILSTIKEDEKFTEAGDRISYYGYMMRLPDGLSRVKRSYVGLGGFLKKPVKVQEETITRDPKAFIDFVLGPGIKPSDCATLEDCARIINMPDYKWADRLPQIKEAYAGFLKRVGLKVPKEIKDGDDKKS